MLYKAIRYFLPFGSLAFLSALLFYLQKDFTLAEQIKHIGLHMFCMLGIHMIILGSLSTIRAFYNRVIVNAVLALFYAISAYLVIFLSVASAITFYFWLAPVNSILIRNFLFHINHYTSITFPDYSGWIILAISLFSILILFWFYRVADMALNDINSMPWKTKMQMGRVIIPGIVVLGIVTPISIRNAEYFKQRFVSLKDSFIVHDPVVYTFYLALRRSQLRNIIEAKEKQIDQQIRFVGSQEPRKNLILITIDALRADYVLDSNLRSLTPFLDSLLNNTPQTTYSRAYANSNYSSCSLLSILEGRVSNAMEEKGLSVSHYLSKAGYKSYFILAGSHAGFNHLDIRYGNYIDDYFEGPFSREHSPDSDEVLFEGLEFLGPQAADQPFFLWFHMMGVHFVSERMPEFRKHQPDDFNLWSKADSANTLRYVNNYRNGVMETDHRLRRLFLKLKERQLLENTVILLTADHGENLGEYADLGHGRTLSPEQLHIPLIVINGSDTARIRKQMIFQINFPELICENLEVPVPDIWRSDKNRAATAVISSVSGETGIIDCDEASHYRLKVLQEGTLVSEYLLK